MGTEYVKNSPICLCSSEMKTDNRSVVEEHIAIEIKLFRYLIQYVIMIEPPYRFLMVAAENTDALIFYWLEKTAQVLYLQLDGLIDVSA